MVVAVAAVAPSSTGQAGGNGVLTESWTHTIGSGTNRVLYVGVTVGVFTADPALTTTVTCGGTAMTSIGKVKSGNADNGYQEVFRLINPPTGAQSIVVTSSSTSSLLLGGSIELTGVDQTTPNSAIAGSNFGTSTAASTAAVSSAVGNIVLAFCVAGSNITASTGTNQDGQNVSQTNGGGGGESGRAGGATVGSIVAVKRAVAGDDNLTNSYTLTVSSAFRQSAAMCSIGLLDPATLVATARVETVSGTSHAIPSGTASADNTVVLTAISERNNT